MAGLNKRERTIKKQELWNDLLDLADEASINYQETSPIETVFSKV